MLVILYFSTGVMSLNVALHLFFFMKCLIILLNIKEVKYLESIIKNSINFHGLKTVNSYRCFSYTIIKILWLISFKTYITINYVIWVLFWTLNGN